MPGQRHLTFVVVDEDVLVPWLWNVVVDVGNGDGEGVGSRHGLVAVLAPHVPHDDRDVVVLLLLPVKDGLG